jgi:hypothetical protein
LDAISDDVDADVATQRWDDADENDDEREGQLGSVTSVSL